MSAIVGVGPRPANPSCPMLARTFHWIVIMSWCGTLTWSVGGGMLEVPLVLDSLPWIVAIAIVDLFPLTGWRRTTWSGSQPLQAAAAFLLSPPAAALAGFLGAMDPREFRGKISLRKSLFNRSQIALAIYIASSLVHRVQPAPSQVDAWLLASAALGLIFLANFGFVVTALALEYKQRLSGVAANLPIGGLFDFSLAAVSAAVLAGMLVLMVQHLGAGGLAAFLAPTLLARQALFRSQTSIDTSRAYRSRERALAQISKQIEAERRDERRLIAAHLHDEVLQPLFKVTLMAQVLRNDIREGRLLELDDDLPELLTATDLASTTLRELIGDLRKSSLGRGGLAPALLRLVSGLRSQSAAEIRVDLGRVQADPSTELVLYQVAKEALHNAVAHSRATEIALTLFQDDRAIVIEVTDDGIGFEPSAEWDDHFGLAIMRERAEHVGASIYFDCEAGRGSRVTLVAGAGRSPAESPDNAPPRDQDKA